MIYNIDTIGTHSGMDRYDEAFSSILSQRGIANTTISNFSSTFSRPYFQNFYTGGKVTKITTLLKSFWRYCVWFMGSDKKNDVFIYQSYGLRGIDLLFILPLLFSRKWCLVIHDVYSINKNQNMTFFSKWFYKYVMTCAITHSKEVTETIKKIGFRKTILEVPLFRYSYDRSYDLDRLGTDIGSIRKETNVIQLLFFGVIRSSKGLDIAIDALLKLEPEERARFLLIVAGRQIGSYLRTISSYNFIRIINRYIDLNEMKHLFTVCHYALLPYRKIFQSDVLNTAVHFRLPVISSALPYFTEFFQQFPSFGHVFGTTADELTLTLRNLIQKGETYAYYTETDLGRYYSADTIKEFLSALQLWINHV